MTYNFVDWILRIVFSLLATVVIMLSGGLLITLAYKAASNALDGDFTAAVLWIVFIIVFAIIFKRAAWMTE